MWAESDFPGTDHVPWALLIRARTEYDVNLLVASAVARAVASHAAFDVASKVASVARAVGPKQEDSKVLSPEQHLSVLQAFADFDEMCPRPWHPHGPHHVFDEIGDALAYITFPAALALVASVGSDGLGPLNEVLSEAVQQ